MIIEPAGRGVGARFLLLLSDAAAVTPHSFSTLVGIQVSTIHLAAEYLREQAREGDAIEPGRLGGFRHAADALDHLVADPDGTVCARCFGYAPARGMRGAICDFCAAQLEGIEP